MFTVAACSKIRTNPSATRMRRRGPPSVLPHAGKSAPTRSWSDRRHRKAGTPPTTRRSSCADGAGAPRSRRSRRWNADSRCSERSVCARKAAAPMTSKSAASTSTPTRASIPVAASTIASMVWAPASTSRACWRCCAGNTPRHARRQLRRAVLASRSFSTAARQRFQRSHGRTKAARVLHQAAPRDEADEAARLAAARAAGLRSIIISLLDFFICLASDGTDPHHSPRQDQ
jgi:hypothetical protein